MKPERFLMFVPAASAGGIATFTAGYAGEILRRGKNVLVVLWVDLSSPYSPKRRGLFDQLPTRWVEFDSLDKASTIAKCLSTQLGLRNGDFLISQNLPWIGHIVLHERQTKNIFHGELLHGDNKFYYALAEVIISTCDLYLAVSNRIAKKLRARLDASGVGGIPIAVCSAGIEVPSLLSRSSDHDSFRICFVGRLCQEEKRIYDLIPIAKYLMEADVDFEFSIIGGGNEEANLRQRFSEIGANRRVHLLGNRPHTEVLEHLMENHAIILTSAHEGGPMVICEAMAHGVVPVTTPVGICAEIISNGDNGFLVEIGEVHKMAERLRELAEYPEFWSRMSSNALETARKELSISSRVDTFLKAVEEARAARANRENFKTWPLRNRRILDHSIFPNVLARSIRKVWRFFKGRPSDAAPRKDKETIDQCRNSFKKTSLRGL